MTTPTSPSRCCARRRGCGAANALVRHQHSSCSAVMALAADLRAVHRAVRSRRRRPRRHLLGPDARALARHRRARPRHPEPHDLRRADRAARRRSDRGRLSTILGILLGPARRMARRLDRRRARPRLRRDLRVPGAAARDHGGRAVRQGPRGTGDRDEHRVHPVRGATDPHRSSPSERSRPYVAAYRVQGFRAAGSRSRRVLPNVTPDRRRAVDPELRLRARRARRPVVPRPRRAAADRRLGRDDQRGARRALLGGHFLPALVPAVAVVIVVVAVNVIGEELSDRIGGGIPA